MSEAYEADKAQARSAAGGPTEFQGKAAVSDGLVRFTAPSVVFEDDGRRLEAGGFQPLEAYDVCDREPRPDARAPAAARGARSSCSRTSPRACARRRSRCCSPATSSTSTAPRAEDALLELVADGRATREPLGDDAIWRAA